MDISQHFSTTELSKFRIGDLFGCYFDDLPRIGWITGLTLNPTREVIFRVRYADSPEVEYSKHPHNMYPLDIF